MRGSTKASRKRQSASTNNRPGRCSHLSLKLFCADGKAERSETCSSGEEKFLLRRYKKTGKGQRSSSRNKLFQSASKKNMLKSSSLEKYIFALCGRLLRRGERINCFCWESCEGRPLKLIPVSSI